MTIRKFKTQIAMILLALIISVQFVFAAAGTSNKLIIFNDLQKQTCEFLGYYHSIQLSAAQEQVKKNVLSSMPAVCCKDYSMHTCCCTCNFSKALWGLSNYLIAKRNADEAQLKQAVLDWVAFTKPNGYTGDGCYKGLCGNPFHANGCGGMDESPLVF